MDAGERCLRTVSLRARPGRHVWAAALAARPPSLLMRTQTSRSHPAPFSREGLGASRVGGGTLLKHVAAVLDKVLALMPCVALTGPGCLHETRFREGVSG